MVEKRLVVLSLPEFNRLLVLVEAGNVGEIREESHAAIELTVLIRERLVRVVGGYEIVTDAGHSFVRDASVSGLTVSGELDET